MGLIANALSSVIGASCTSSSDAYGDEGDLEGEDDSSDHSVEEK